MTAAPPDKPKRKHRATGRPRGGKGGNGGTRYTRQLADQILKQVALGETLPAACRALNFPRESVAWWAINNRDGFAARYAQARASQMEAWSDKIIETAEDLSLDPNDKRVRIDTHKWLMSKLAPHKYGDKLTVAGDPDAPIRHVHETIRREVDQLNKDELRALLAFIAAGEAKEAKVIDGESEEVNGENKAITD